MNRKFIPSIIISQGTANVNVTSLEATLRKLMIHVIDYKIMTKFVNSYA